MGRKSKLTEKQWLEIERRILVEGESVYRLAKEFGVNESSIRRRVRPNSADKAERAEKHHPELREIAVRKVKADEEARRVAEQIAQLPFGKQQIVEALSRRLSNISHHLAGAAEFSAATTHRLAGIANAKLQELDDGDPLSEKGMQTLKVVAALTDLANKSGTIPMNLLAANKETIRSLTDGDGEPERTIDAGKLSDQALKELLDARA